MSGSYTCLIEVDEEEGETEAAISSKNELDIACVDGSMVMEAKEHIPHRTCNVCSWRRISEPRGQLGVAGLIKGEVVRVEKSGWSRPSVVPSEI